MNNHRILKNIIMVIIVIIAISSIIFTGYLANKKLASTTTETKEVTGNSTSKNPPSMDGEPPEKPDGEEPSVKPSEDSSKESSNNNNESQIKEEVVTSSKAKKITIKYYIAFAIESTILIITLIYLIMSKFNYDSFSETFEYPSRIINFIFVNIILIAILTYGCGFITNKIIKSNTKTIIKYKEINNTKEKEDNPKPPSESEENNTNNTSKATKEITTEKELTSTYESSDADESVILVKDGGKATINKATINKKSGDSTNNESSDFYGINAAILVEKESSANINDSKITSNAKGSNAVFSTGTNSKIYIKDTEITTTGSNGSRGLDATYGGYIEADNVTITTKGSSSATLATDRGEGTLKVNNSNLTTFGAGSPVIYSTGDISITDTNGVANSSQMVVIEGKNKATITSSELYASGAGNRNNVDKAGIMIYQSMSGDASVGKGTLTVTDSSLEISSSSTEYKTAPMFFVTNTDAEINITNTRLNYGSNILLSAVGTSEWGKTGENGGNVTFNATNQSLRGNIILDNLSTLSLNLTNSAYRGAINSTNAAKEINLKLDRDSSIVLTADSYITKLDNEDSTNSNINFNNHKLYVNGVAIN